MHHARFWSGVLATLVALFSGTSADPIRAQDRPLRTISSPPSYSNCHIRLDEQFRIGALDTPDEEVFGSVTATSLSSHGLLYVLDGQAAIVRAYDLHGRFVRRFGSRGQGPGTFDRPARIAVGGGTVYVFDQLRNALVSFDTAGAFKASRTLAPLPSLSVPFIAADEKSIFYAGLPRGASPESPVVARYDTAISRVLSRGGHVPVRVAATDAAFLASGPVEPDGIGGFWFTPLFEYHLQHYNALGELDRVVGRDHNFLFYPTTRSEVDEPEHHPLVRLGLDQPRAYMFDLTLDERGRLWVLVEDKVADAITIDVFDAAGGAWLVSSSLSIQPPRPNAIYRGQLAIGRTSTRGYPQVVIGELSLVGECP